MAVLRWGAATDAGRIRPDNEDNLLAEPRVFVVADGMGGHRAGEVASALAVDLLRSRLSAPGASLDDVVAAIAEANVDIYRAAIGNPEQQGMGTTITALVVVTDQSGPDATTDTGPPPPAVAPVLAPADDESAAAAETPEPIDAPDDDLAGAPHESFALINVGDSRTYMLRHGRLRRVTIDHSYVQELVMTGHITDDEARTHPRRNIVTRALGIDPSVRVDAWTLPIVRGDRFLLCSDGLVDEVRDDEIVAVLNTIADAQAAADELVAVANRRGGRDNITVVVVDVLAGAEPPDPDTELDLEPAWDDGATAGTWAVDDPEGEATEFEDLAALVSGEETVDGADPTATAAATTAGAATPAALTTDQIPVVTAPTDRPRRKRRLTGFLGGIGLVAVIVLAFVIAAAWARRGYFVAFDDADDVVIYRGQNGGFLWFNPTEEAPTVFARIQLDDDSIARVEREPNFDSRQAAERFVTEQLETTTTTSTTSTTTTVPATTTPPTTVAP